MTGGSDLTVAAVVAAELAAAGISTGFGVIGEGNLAVIYDLVETHGLSWIAARREDGGVAMADGYARRSGTLGFAAVTHGPALTNAVTTLVEAAKAGTPLIVLTGEFPADGGWHPQWLPQGDLLASIGIDVVPVTSAASAAAQTRAAADRAVRLRRPVVLSVPTDLQGQPAGPQRQPAKKLTGADTRSGLVPPEPDQHSVDHAAALIEAAMRPIVVAGHGALAAGAATPLAELADRIGGLLGTTLRGNGLFADHRWNIGVVGGFARPEAERLLHEADLVIVFGASLNRYTTDRGDAFGTATVIRVDLSESPAEATCPVTATVTGDAGTVAARLIERLKPRTGEGFRTAAVRAELAGRTGHDIPAGSGDLGPEQLSILLDRILPAGRNVCVDLGYFTSEVAINVAVGSPERFVFPVNFGSVGLGLATAIGAAHADPDTVTLAALGDGGLAMALQELETLARTKARVLVVVYNDAAYGLEYHVLRDQGRDIGLAMFDDVDFAGLARALGIPAATARTPTEAAAAIERLKDGPGLIDVKLDGTVRTRWYQNLTRTNIKEDQS